MAEALALGEDARGCSAPNPNVGCLIVSSSGKVVGRYAPTATPEAIRKEIEALL